MLRNYFLYCITLGTTRPVEFPGRRKKREAELLTAYGAKDCLLGCRKPTNLPTRRSSESPDYAKPTHTLHADNQVGRSDIATSSMYTPLYVPVQ